MDIHIHSPEIEAARQFFDGPSLTIEAMIQPPNELPRWDYFGCGAFALLVSKQGAESGVVLRVLSSVERTASTHPADFIREG